MPKETRTDYHKELGKFSGFLKKKGLKITSQRLLVAEKIFRMGAHFSVDSLADSLKERRDEISRATIYRIVSLMVEAGQLAEHDFGQNVKFYEHVIGNEHHDHIVCMDCGHIVEFSDSAIEKEQLAIASNHNFILNDHSLILYGQCKKLKDTGKCEFKKP